jgi:hypothetical protein
MVDVFMALLSFRAFDTPNLPAQGEQRRSTYFNIGRDISADIAERLLNNALKAGRPIPSTRAASVTVNPSGSINSSARKGPGCTGFFISIVAPQ